MNGGADLTASSALSVQKKSHSQKVSSSSMRIPVSGSASATPVSSLRDRLKVVNFCRCYQREGVHQPDSYNCNGPWVYAVVLYDSPDAPRIAYRDEARADSGLAILRTYDDSFIAKLFLSKPFRGFLPRE
jgi:hypothetical protein